MGLSRAIKFKIYLVSLAILLPLGWSAAHAQIERLDIGSKGDTDAVGETSILPQPDRETRKQLKDAHILIEKERFAEAVRILGNLLRLPEDSFFTSTSSTAEEGIQIRGLHDEAEQILGTLPQRAIELYELQFGAQAKHLLEKAIQNGDTQAPTDISRRFFYTVAGAEATWLSGLIAMDEGRWKSAILAFERLGKISGVANHYEPLLSFLKTLCMNQAGQNETAEKTWQNLRKRFPDASIAFAGKKIPLFTNSAETFEHFLAQTELSELKTSENLETLFTSSNQALPFGTPQRNASVNAGLPLLKQIWRTRITDRPLAETMLQKRRETYLDSGTMNIPRFYPLVVDGIFFGRTLNTLIAIDTKTGKRLWETEIDQVDKAIEERSLRNSTPSSFLQGLISRIWSDSIFGQISSDGRNVYAVEASSIPDLANFQRQQILGPGIRRIIISDNDQAQGPFNSLVAFDAKTGQRRWTLSNDLDDSSLFFLGPPLPLDGSLYTLAEGPEEIRLIAITSTSGKINWSQRIAMIEKPQSRHASIRYRQQNSNARMPAMADDIMICPTGEGAIIAIEPTTRTLLWAHCYERLGKKRNQVIFVNGVPRVQNQNRIGEELLIHDGCVFSVPTDSNYLYCLELNTGKELWKENFSNGVFLGGIHKDRLLVVGREELQTVNTKNGKKIDTCNLKESLGQNDPVLITGRGFRNQGIYYAPTSSHHFIAFDIEKGKVTQQTYTHEPIILGNLVATEDQIFSQSLDGIEAFHQLKAVRARTEKQLQRNPNDLDAIAMQGELLLAEEKIDQAIEKFRQVHRTQPTPLSGARLFDAFCIALKESYPQYRDARPEIESLLQTESQKSKYWHLCIGGEISENNLEAAADACFKLASFADDPSSMFVKDRHHAVRQDRFVQAQLATIYERLDAPRREKLAQKILAQLETAMKSSNTLDLHHAWNCYASLPPVVERYTQIAQQIWETDPALAELILERNIRFGDPSVAATAMVQWAELLRNSDRLDEAAACYRQAIHHWKEIPLLSDPGQTPGTKVAAMPPEDPIRSRLMSPDTWPQKSKIENLARTESQENVASIHRKSHLAPIGRPSPIFQDKQIIFTGQSLELVDQYNRKIGELSLAEEGNQDAIYYGNSGIRCSTLGHMILLELPRCLLAIDAWNPQQPKIAWKTERGTLMDLPEIAMAGNNFCRMHFNGFPTNRFNNNHSFLGMPGIDFGFQFLTLSGNELIAIDPFDGTPLWNRRKIPNQIDLNSDGTTLFVSQPNQRNTPAISMQLVDGSHQQTQEKLTKAESSTKNSKQGKETEKEKIERKAGMLVKKLFMRSTRNTRPPQKILAKGRNILTFRYLSREYHFAMVDCLTKKTIWGPKAYKSQSSWGLLGQEYVGVIDSKGNFELLRIADGKTLIQQTLKLDGRLQGIFLQDLGDRVGVIVATNPKANRHNHHMSYLPITQYLQQGRLYTFDWDGRPGMPEHKDGILIEQQGILINPPTKLPVITLLSQDQNQNNPQNPWTAKLQVLDSRSGKTILSQEIPASIQTFNLVGDPEKKTVQYQINDKNFSIQFK